MEPDQSMFLIGDVKDVAEIIGKVKCVQQKVLSVANAGKSVISLQFVAGADWDKKVAQSTAAHHIMTHLHLF